MRTPFKILILIIPLAFLSTKCDNTSYQIPYVDINLHLNIISQLGNPLNDSYKFIDGGVNGLIVYREDFNLFHVYDRTCTMYPEHNAKVAADTTGFVGVFVCPECGSQYLLSMGSDPIKGPAVFGLHEYRSVIDGDLEDGLVTA